MWCDRSHRHSDAELGQPLCGDCYDYVAHVLFTWHAPELWRRFTIRVRRLCNASFVIAASSQNTHGSRS